MNSKSLKSLALSVAFGLPTLAVAQTGGGFSLTWSAIGGGGGASSGASFSLNGTIGQPDAGALSGGTFSIEGSFWSGVDAAPEQPRLSIVLATGNRIILSWPNPSTGYVLEQTDNLSAPGSGWTDVSQSPVINGPAMEVTLPIADQARMFRLRRTLNRAVSD